MDNKLFLDACAAQYQAMFQMVGEAVKGCPEELWDARWDEPPFWQQAYHTLWAVDYYVSRSPEEYRLDPRFDQTAHNLAKRPVEAASRELVLEYLDKVNRKCAQRLKDLAAADLGGKDPFPWTGPTLAHHLIYNLRHAQHHVGWMNSILRRKGAQPAEWICTP
jgi:hypothetical protein